jgi:hypothetical protein
MVDSRAVIHDRRAGNDTVPSDPSGLLIIRAWIEEGSSEPLRAQIRVSTDVSAGFERTLTLARTEDVSTAVQEWLADMLNESSGTTD